MKTFEFMPIIPYFPFPYSYYDFMLPPSYQQHQRTEIVTNMKAEQIKKEEEQNTDYIIKIQKTQKKRQKDELQDDLWSPDCKYGYNQGKRKRKNYHSIIQKQDRNAISNIFRCFLKFLSTKQAVNDLERLKRSYSCSVSTDGLIKWFNQNNINHRNYVRLQSIIKIIMKDISNKGQHAKIFTMLFVSFSKTNIRAHFLTSSKLKQETRNAIITKIRDIQRIMLDLFTDEKDQ